MNAELTTSEFTPEEARQFTGEIQRDGTALWEKVSLAYEGRIWIALSYQPGLAGWQNYIADEFPDGLLTPPRDRELEAIQHYVDQGMGTRAISQVVNLSQKTVDRRARELRQVSQNDSPGTVQGLDGKQYSGSKGQPYEQVVDAEIIDEGEKQQPDSAPPRSVSNGSGRLEGGDVHGSDFGFEAFDEEPGQDALQVSEKAIRDTIRDFNGTGSADTEQIKKTAMELVSHLRSGLVPAEAWDEDELTIVAEDTMDTVSVLLDLLLAMAQPNYSNGVSRAAIADSDVRGQLSTVTQKLEALSGVINSGAPAA